MTKTCGAPAEHAFGGASTYAGHRQIGFYPPLWVGLDGSVSGEPLAPRCEDAPTVALVRQPETGDLLEVSNLSQALRACYPRPHKWQPHFASPEAYARHCAFRYRQARAAISSRRALAPDWWSPGVVGWCGLSYCRYSCNHKRVPYIRPPTGELV